MTQQQLVALVDDGAGSARHSKTCSIPQATRAWCSSPFRVPEVDHNCAALSEALIESAALRP
jgi:hypothetical protein